MKIDSEIAQDTVIMRLSGELDVHTAEIFKASADEFLDKGYSNVILNLEEVSFIDSSGLGAILGRYKRISSNDGRMVIVKPKPHVRQVLELSGLRKIIPIYYSEKTALNRLTG